MAADRERIKALLGPDFGSIRFRDPVRRDATDTPPLFALEFATATGDKVPALFLPPAKAGELSPAVLYCHAHGARYEIGTRELTDGRPALIGPYLPDLAAAGVAVLCLEMPCFETRSTMAEDATAKARLWHGRTLFGQMLGEQRAGLDWLVAQPGIDPGRIGAMGISMGGTLAWWLAALDQRIKAAVSMCCFADLAGLIETGAHDGHGNYMTVPGLLAHCSTGQLSGLTAPRALLHCVGLQDWSTPPDCFAAARIDLEDAYGAAQAGRMLNFHIEPDIGHSETTAMRARVLRFLAENL